MFIFPGKPFLGSPSLDAAAEPVRIAGAIGSADSVWQAAERIPHKLGNDPADEVEYLSEALCFIDDEPLRAFLRIDVESMVVETTGFRILWSANDCARLPGPLASR